MFFGNPLDGFSQIFAFRLNGGHGFSLFYQFAAAKERLSALEIAASRLREQVPRLEEDRFMASDIEAAAMLVPTLGALETIEGPGM